LPDFETLKDDERLLRLIAEEKAMVQSGQPKDTDTSSDIPSV
jgi:hypothetical protein